MKRLSFAFEGVKALRDLVVMARDARRAKVNDALTGYAAGRSAHEAAANAGHSVRRDDGVYKPREPGCQCQWEEGDSPCPVHGEHEE